MVTAEQFEQALELSRKQALARTGNASAGLFGPSSPCWEVNREAVLLLGGGAAALLQLAHPFVAQAVHAHSRVRRDVAIRFRRTFARLLAMIFGDLDSAITAARRVRAIHDRVHGQFPEAVGRFSAGGDYSAHDDGAIFWVHATLLHTGTRVFADLVRPLKPGELGRIYEGGKPVALLFGLLPESSPADFPAFVRYFQTMLDGDMLCVGPAARELADHILTPPNAAVRPFYRFVRAYTAALLPERLRRGFGLPYGAAERALLCVTLPAVRASVKRLPHSARFFPQYLDAVERLRVERSGGACDPKSDIERRASHSLSRSLLRFLRPSFTAWDLFR